MEDTARGGLHWRYTKPQITQGIRLEDDRFRPLATKDTSSLEILEVVSVAKPDIHGIASLAVWQNFRAQTTKCSVHALLLSGISPRSREVLVSARSLALRNPNRLPY